MDVPLWAWLAVLGVILAMLGVASAFATSTNPKTKNAGHVCGASVSLPRSAFDKEYHEGAHRSSQQHY